MGKRAAGFLIFRRSNEQIEYLLLKASNGNKHWSPPKGNVKQGEDDFTTAIRKAHEEAGYTTVDLKFYKDQKTLDYQVNDEEKMVIYWLAELRNPRKNPILSEEHTEFRWLKKDDVIALCVYDDFAEMVKHFHDRIDS